MSSSIDRPISSMTPKISEDQFSQVISVEEPTLRQTLSVGDEEDSKSEEKNSKKKGKIIFENFETKPIEILTEPQNFSWRKKWLLTSIVNSIFSAVVSIYSNQMEKELTIDLDFMNRLQGLNVPATVFNLGSTIGPIFVAPIAETCGTIPMIKFSGALFVFLNMASGFMVTQSQLLLFRLCAGLVVSIPSSLSQFILARIWGKNSRGTPMCLNSLSTIVATSIGNVIGGWTVGKIDWRWTFWISSLTVTILHILLTLLLPETIKARKLPSKPSSRPLDPALCEEWVTKAESLSEQIGISISSTSDKVSSHSGPGNSRTLGFHNGLVPLPLWISLNDPLVLLLALQMGMIYTLFFIVQARIIQLYQQNFHQTAQISSLHCLSMSLGAICAHKLNTNNLSAICDRLGIKSNPASHRPEYKFRCMFPGILFLPIGTMLFGLGKRFYGSWILPDAGLFLLGAGIIFGNRKGGTYMIDTFGCHAPSALASFHMFRRIGSFSIPIILKLKTKNDFTYEWVTFGSSIVSIFVICPLPILLFLRGSKLRRLPLVVD